MTTIQPSGPQRIVVGVDGSPQSKQALRWAAGIAAATGAQIEAISAWEYPVSFGWAPVGPEWNMAAATHKMLTDTVDEVFGAERPLGLELSVREGYPTHILTEASKGALMIVVGSRGHGGMASMLLGAVSAAVAEHADCPVLVMHGDLPWPVRS